MICASMSCQRCTVARQRFIFHVEKAFFPIAFVKPYFGPPTRIESSSHRVNAKSTLVAISASDNNYAADESRPIRMRKLLFPQVQAHMKQFANRHREFGFHWPSHTRARAPVLLCSHKMARVECFMNLFGTASGSRNYSSEADVGAGKYTMPLAYTKTLQQLLRICRKKM